MWQDNLKNAGINIHVIATGAGAGLQQELWSTPGSSAYLSGASFPYSAEEQEELLGFKPEHFCSPEAAVDLASAAYMKAYQFGGKKPVGVGITASVASEKVHRGEHQIYACIISDNKVAIHHQILTKGVGHKKREVDGFMADDIGTCAVLEAIQTGAFEYHNLKFEDATELAVNRFNNRCLFMPDGKRLSPTDFQFDGNIWALMPGAFNPPHQGHFGLANQVQLQYGTQVIFEVCTVPPHKPALTVQQMLQRAKLLKGHNALFTQDPLYIDKARAHPHMPIVAGADAMMRILDPKWGNPEELIKEFTELGTEFFIGSRVIDGKLITRDEIVKMIPASYDIDIFNFRSIKGQWDISSTEIRNKLL